MSKRMAYTVQGEVQGVFFRDFTQQKASSYDLTGKVWNADDGSVRVEAQGDADALKKLEKDLLDGPRNAHVVKLIPTEIEVKEGESSFER